jgi:hypothetical protein
MLKEARFFYLPLGIRPRGTTFEYEYLREFETECDNNLGCELGAHIGSIHENIRATKFRATVPLTFRDVHLEKRAPLSREKNIDRCYLVRNLRKRGEKEIKYERKSTSTVQGRSVK